MAKKKKDIKNAVESEYPDFVEAVQGLSVADLEKKLTTSAKHRVQQQEGMEAHKQLSDVKEKIKEMNELKKELEGPYKDSIEATDLQSQYLVLLMREKGGQV
jgi:hypothetical protein